MHRAGDQLLSIEVDPIGSSRFGIVAPDAAQNVTPRSAARTAGAVGNAAQVTRDEDPRRVDGREGIRLGRGVSRPHPDIQVEVTRARGGSAGTETVVISARSDGGWQGQRVAAFRAACARAVASASEGETIVLANPVYIGATRDFLIRPLEERGFAVGRDIHVAFVPVGLPAATRGSTRLVGGATVDCALAAVHSVVNSGPVEVVSTPEMAEAAALAAYPRSRIGPIVKRVVDVSVAAVGLVLILPLSILVAAAIRVDDRGPVLFTQERIGINGRPFRIRKFRTMVAGAESRLDEVAGLNGIRGPAFQISSDPRLTRIGGLLRKTSIDELPQLWNVLVGDMSLVGPRPAPPVEVAAYEPWHRGRLTMRPGITGLAQVRARSYVDFDEKASLDLEYIIHWSPRLDMEILVRTVPVVLRLTGR